jgi:hypothetical protein
MPYALRLQVYHRVSFLSSVKRQKKINKFKLNITRIGVYDFFKYGKF